MRYTAAALAPIVALLLVGAVAHAISEDDPRWDCATMGNRTCVGRVVRVVDGDTLKVQLVGPGVRTIRVLGIDTPESHKPGVKLECGARKASENMDRIALGKYVRVKTDSTQDARDRYGRILAYVNTPQRDVGRAQVIAGWAKVYVFRRPFRRVKSYRASARRAERLRKGVWSRCGGDFHSNQ